jgi:hypothetical protein
LIFANPGGLPFKPDSISAAVSLLFRRPKLPVDSLLQFVFDPLSGTCKYLLSGAGGLA